MAPIVPSTTAPSLDRTTGASRTTGLLGAPLTPSGVVLVLANTAALVGVAVLGWDVFPLVLLYWLENVIIGGFNVLRMLTLQPRNIGTWIGKVIMVPFFVFHYGMFTAIHGMFVLTMFGRGIRITGFIPPPEVVWTVVTDYHLQFAVGALLLSHAWSFVRNYLHAGEHRRATLETLMRQPYARVMLLHVGIIVGGFVVLAVGAPMVALLLLIVAKTALDLRAHLREHHAPPT